MHASRLWLFYSVYFQIKQIPATDQNSPEKNNPFSIKPYCRMGCDMGIWCYINYPWYWFYRWSNSTVLCSCCKNTFVGAGRDHKQILIWNLMVALCIVSGPSFLYSFSFLKSWSITSPERKWAFWDKLWIQVKAANH